jgi:phosphoglycerol transferase MdoB-like AlkP superfamily enzyme
VSGYVAVRNSTLLTADAKNRAIRTLVQNLGVDVVVALVAVLLPVFQDANSFGDFEWAIIGFSLVKTFALTVFAFIMRRFLDASALPTPVPPEYPGEPADGGDHTPAGEGGEVL